MFYLLPEQCVLGPWLDLEKLTRDWARLHGGIYVISGSIIKAEPATIWKDPSLYVDMTCKIKLYIAYLSLIGSFLIHHLLVLLAGFMVKLIPSLFLLISTRS